MKCRPQPRDAFELFQSHFDQMLDSRHELVIPANKIGWSGLEAAFVDTYCLDIGAPAKAVRLMVGLHYLKYAFDESDESVVARWVENPYWQYFCGYTHMQHECPIHPTSMTKWRNRVGVERLEALLKETIALAVREKHLPRNDLERVTVDTTVQEKNITRAERKRRRRRSAIEPKIGHLKSDHRMGRCFLARLAGDAINAALAAAGSNLRKLLGLIRRKAGRFVFALIQAYRNPMTALPDPRPFQLAAA